MPQTFNDVVELLLPELRKRGLFWEDYAVPGGTYRENLNETTGQCHPHENHPAAAYQWRRPVAGTNGYQNGTANSAQAGINFEHLDPQSMQLA